MKFAVIEIAGKQYKVSPGDKIKINSPKLGEIKILLLADEKGVKIGSPYIKDIMAEAKVLKQGREKKKIVFRYKPKTRYRKKKGHRQSYTEIEILKIKAK